MNADEKQAKAVKIKLVKRDVEILTHINQFGFAQVSNVAKMFDFSERAAYARLHKLSNAGYLNYEQIFHHQPGVFFLSRKGLELCGDYLPPLKQVSVVTYHHDLMVLKIATTLMRHHPDAEFKTERMLRHDRGGYAVGNRGHLSDGEWWTDDRPIAIEVELSQKGSRRRERIFAHYRRETQYKEVWYFCGTEKLASQVSAYADRFNFLRVFTIDKWFAQYEAAAEILKAETADLSSEACHAEA